MSAPTFCIHCGKELVPSANFCAYCGIRVGDRERTHDGKTLQEWLDDLVSHDGGARLRALKAMEKLGSKADASIAGLRALLHRESPEGLPQEALLQLGKHVDEAVQVIVTGLTANESEDVRLTHFGSLMKCGERAAPAVPALIETVRAALRGQTAFPDVGPNAARALGWIGPQAALAVPELIRLLQQEDASLRAAGAFALGRIGSPAALLDLERIAKDPDPEVRKEVKKALKQLRR